MARKGHGKRRYNLRKVRFTPTVALGTLNAGIALSNSLTAVAINAYRAVSLSCSWSIFGIAGTDGPVTVGYAHSDYSVTEIKECLESNASIDRGDKIAMEQSNRLIRIVGTFLPGGQASLNDGRPVKTRLNWYIGTGDTVNVFVMNEGITMTTGALVNLNGQMYVKDSV